MSQIAKAHDPQVTTRERAWDIVSMAQDATKHAVRSEPKLRSCRRKSCSDISKKQVPFGGGGGRGV